MQVDILAVNADAGDDASGADDCSRQSRNVAGTPTVAGPDQEVDQLVLVLLSAINLARRSIRVAIPYFLPDEQIITALQLAVLLRDGAAGGRLALRVVGVTHAKVDAEVPSALLLT